MGTGRDSNSLLMAAELRITNKPITSFEPHARWCAAGYYSTASVNLWISMPLIGMSDT
jgi:hypothetical protein